MKSVLAVTVNRRDFLKGAAAGAAGSALTGVVLVGWVHADARANPTTTIEVLPIPQCPSGGCADPRSADMQAYRP